MEINRLNIRTLSMLGECGAFGLALSEFAEQNENVVALSADLCKTSGLDRFRSHFPDRFINTGIAEQNLIGVSAGLAAGGNIPFATTFSNFFSLRACEQIRHFLGYMQENVKLVGFASGFSMGLFGTTHYGLEDIAAIRAINNLTILSPADGLETYKCVIESALFKGPVYIRLSGSINMPIIYKEDYNFEIGKAITLKDGSDIAIISTGTMVYNSLKAAKILEEKGLSVKVINMHTLKPLDVTAVKECCSCKLIVTVEEHSIYGGLGSAVAEYKSKSKIFPPQLILGVKDKFEKAGNYTYMLDKYGLSHSKIAEQILKFIDNL